jgi:metal-sulfur cluster biosynthetic enzyme
MNAALPASPDDVDTTAVWAALNAIIDPCSRAMAVPLGLGDMGLVQEIRVKEGRVDVLLLPTTPHCLFVGLFEEAIVAQVGALDGVASVQVRLDEGDTIWDESRMTVSARKRLVHRRAALRHNHGLPARPVAPDG